MAKLALNVNGKAVTVTADDPNMPLLDALKNDLDLHGSGVHRRAGGAVRLLH